MAHGCCKAHNIQYEAYSPLRGGEMNKPEVVRRRAERAWGSNIMPVYRFGSHREFLMFLIILRIPWYWCRAWPGTHRLS